MSAEQKEAELSSSRIYHKTKFDSLLKKIGEFGKFQKIQWFLLFLAIIPQSWYTYAPAFAVRKVKPDQMSCGNNGNISGEAVCKIWHNKTYCGDVNYQTDFTSVATDVSISDITRYSLQAQADPGASGRLSPNSVYNIKVNMYHVRLEMRICIGTRLIRDIFAIMKCTRNCPIFYCKYF